jgi:tRNA (cmo5U34)-methyltransferase
MFRQLVRRLGALEPILGYGLDRLRHGHDEPPVAIQDLTRVDDGRAHDPLGSWREANDVPIGRFFAFAGLRLTNMQAEDQPGGMGPAFISARTRRGVGAVREVAILRGMPSEEWTSALHVRRYLDRADDFPGRAEGESVLLAHVPRDARRILDLGTGDGRLLALLRGDRPDMRGVGVDFSEPMLRAARERFDGDESIELLEHDLVEPLPPLGCFDAVVSSMAIHHLEHERKRSLYAEVFDALNPGGVFANFEHVASPTRRLHLAFFAAIGEPLEHEDPSDRLLDVESQLGWLRTIGFDDVDCYWKWLEMALLIGIKPGSHD